MATKVNVRPHRGASPPSEGMWKWSQLVMPISSKSCCSVESFSSISGDDIKEQEKKKGLSGEIFSVGAFKVLGHNTKVLFYTTQEA